MLLTIQGRDNAWSLRGGGDARHLSRSVGNAGTLANIPRSATAGRQGPDQTSGQSLAPPARTTQPCVDKQG